MSVLMNFAMFPTDKGSSVSEYVSKIVKLISESGFDYKLTAMGTIIETENIEQALKIVEKSYKLLESGSQRVYSTISFDIQTNKAMGRLNAKVKSVEDKLLKNKSR
ncbi:MAG TPA: MTH1187 family thiamine-binding protein [Bacteroidales bacterium]|nr:MTH1187 family thiamine-binding protein [Bacteroidales bacterium]